jgi:lipid II:glycine glycyltransferase (peptidoglycan interpeptide bridge formation enzyme)
LSPFGLYCGISSRNGTPRYQETLATFFRAYAKRYRSAFYCLPFYGSLEVMPPPAERRIENYSTHVLDLGESYERIFATRFKGATRTCIRRAESSNVQVTITRERQDVELYYEVHRRLAAERGGYGDLHPLKLLIELVNRCSRCELAVARLGTKIISGGIFFDDGPSIFYWHGASDRNFASLQPNYSLLSLMIKRAIANGKSFFNFGGSANINSLEAFKESWGATRRIYRVGHVTNPVADRVKTLTGLFRN